MSREEAMKILDEWVSSTYTPEQALFEKATRVARARLACRSKNLKKHMLATAAAMEFYAEKFGEDGDRWWLAGLLHDLDYEKYPDWRNGGHPRKAVEFLREKGIDEEILDAILSHASYTNVPRKTLLAKTLFAVDELTGFIVAVALIKPEKSLSAVDVESVKKRLPEKRFAAGVNREEIYEGTKGLDLSLEEHIENVLNGIKKISSELGLQ